MFNDICQRLVEAHIETEYLVRRYFRFYAGFFEPSRSLAQVKGVCMYFQFEAPIEYSQIHRIQFVLRGSGSLSVSQGREHRDERVDTGGVYRFGDRHILAHEQHHAPTALHLCFGVGNDSPNTDGGEEADLAQINDNPAFGGSRQGCKLGLDFSGALDIESSREANVSELVVRIFKINGHRGNR
jgi:hypothetical protein